MKKFECPACDSNKNFFFKTKNNYILQRCSNCELIWVIDDINDDSIDTLYAEEYYEGGSDDLGYVGINYSDLQVLHRKNSSRILENFINREKISLKNSKILEIGCGYGYMLDEARKNTQ